MSCGRVLSCIVVKLSYLSPSLFCCLMKGHTSWSETSCSYNFYPYQGVVRKYRLFPKSVLGAKGEGVSSQDEFFKKSKTSTQRRCTCTDRMPWIQMHHSISCMAIIMGHARVTRQAHTVLTRGLDCLSYSCSILSPRICSRRSCPHFFVARRDVETVSDSV